MMSNDIRYAYLIFLQIKRYVKNIVLNSFWLGKTLEIFNLAFQQYSLLTSSVDTERVIRGKDHWGPPIRER